MTDKKTFGSYIKTKRLEKGFSQKELAKLLYVTEGAVSKWERGISYPDITLISDICRVLQISEHELITASNDESSRKITKEAKNFRIINHAWFWIPSCLYALALIICFICNLATQGTLSWFFIVLSALICAYSFIPTWTSFFKRNKFVVFTTTSYISICLLLLTCAIYTNGLYWLPIACVGVLMGYTFAFLPIILSKTKLASFKFIIPFTLALILTIVLLFVINAYVPFKIYPAIATTIYGFIPLILTSIICAFRFDRFIKASVSILIFNIFGFFAEHVVNALFDLNDIYYQVNFNDWKDCINGNILFITLASFTALSLIFFIIGLIRIRKNKKHSR